MYPLTFNNKEEHIKHIIENSDFYQKILNDKFKDNKEIKKLEKKL